MAIALAFLRAAVETGVIMVIALVLIRALCHRRAAPFGTLCVGIGYLLGRYSFAGPPDLALLIAISRFLGAGSVIAIFWAWYRRPARALDEG